MAQPVGRGRGVVGAIVSTVVSVVMLLFRVLAQLFGRSRPPSTALGPPYGPVKAGRLWRCRQVLG
jgi:hypothetical protein